MSKQLAIIAQTRSLIAAGDIVGAEAALADLADHEGDHALAVVLEQLQPKDVLAVMREYDPSRASVVNLLVTPEIFARAVVIEKQYRDLSHTHLRGMVNAVIFREDGDPAAFLQAVGDLEGGSEALADYFADKWSRIEAFARTGTFDSQEEDGDLLSEDELFNVAHAAPKVDMDEVADQDWMQLAWLLRYTCPDLFTETVLVLRAKARAFERGETDALRTTDDSDGKVETADTDRGQVTPAARNDEDEESAI
ncbi:MAG: hypothetical protein U1E84_04930 [Rhodoferax sp.]